MLRGVRRRVSIAGVLALLALLPLGALPAGAGGPKNGQGAAKQQSPSSGPKGKPQTRAGAGAAPAPGPAPPAAPPGHAKRAKPRAVGAHPAAAPAAPALPAQTSAPVARKAPGGSKFRGAKAGPRALRAAAPATSAGTVAPAAATTAPQAPAAATPPAPKPATKTRKRAKAVPGTLRRAERRARQRAARREPAARPMAPSHWLPATTPATTVLAAPVVEPAPALRAPSRKPPGDARNGGTPDKGDTDGVLQVVPIVFNALSESVAFVPRAVAWIIGALAALALALLALAFARDRKARELARERETLRADLEALEGAVVPVLPEALGGLALSVTSSPATGPVTGGDFHDAFPLSQDRVAVLVGDVAGSGRKVLADGQLVRHAVRAYLEAGLDPRAAIAMTGAVVEEREEPLFASVVVAVHDRRTGTLTFASAGHEPPVFVGEHGASLPPVSGWSPPLGAGLETGRRQTRIPLPEGTAVCLLTDGVTEARAEGERIGISRVIRWLSALGPGAMSSDVVARLRSEAQPDDDVTVCTLRALTPTATTAPRVEEAVVEGGEPTYLVRFLRDCGLPLDDAEEAGAALAATPDGTRMVASVEIRGGRAIVELAPLRGATTELAI